MKTLHIANTQFEWELAQQGTPDLIQSIERNPVFLQLQFLPFLYAGPEDSVCVTAKPSAAFFENLERVGIAQLKIHLLEERDFSSYTRVESWGASRSVEAWAKSRHVSYQLPKWEIVRQVNSKLFSHTVSPKLPGSAILRSEEEVMAWLKSSCHPKVLKTAFGVSGQGHFLWHPQQEVDSAKLSRFLAKEWQAKRAVIGEPWVNRTFDFSTQWKIDTAVHFLGATLCETDEKGVHKQNSAGDEARLFGDKRTYLEQHKQIAQPILEQIKELGYFGHVGIDAMLYEKEGETHLHPVVEINARKTMGWATLAIQHRHFPNKMLSLSYLPSTSSDENMLPTALMNTRGKKILLPRTLKLFTFI